MSPPRAPGGSSFASNCMVAYAEAHAANSGSCPQSTADRKCWRLVPGENRQASKQRALSAARDPKCHKIRAIDLWRAQQGSGLCGASGDTGPDRAGCVGAGPVQAGLAGRYPGGPQPHGAALACGWPGGLACGAAAPGAGRALAAVRPSGVGQCAGPGAAAAGSGRRGEGGTPGHHDAGGGSKDTCGGGPSGSSSRGWSWVVTGGGGGSAEDISGAGRDAGREEMELPLWARCRHRSGGSGAGDVAARGSGGQRAGADWRSSGGPDRRAGCAAVAAGGGPHVTELSVPERRAAAANGADPRGASRQLRPGASHHHPADQLLQSGHAAAGLCGLDGGWSGSRGGGHRSGGQEPLGAACHRPSRLGHPAPAAGHPACCWVGNPLQRRRLRSRLTRRRRAAGGRRGGSSWRGCGRRGGWRHGCHLHRAASVAVAAACGGDTRPALGR
eukprot:XP_001702712.1 predicted protein [Chlamydomonas reinhardtii]